MSGWPVTLAGRPEPQMTITLAPDLHVLGADALERFGARAGVCDAGATAPAEDLAELREAGYLLMAVPVELGGLGGNLVQVCHQQRRLARRAPTTAQAVNAHLTWTGAAAELRRSGDDSFVRLLEEAAAGEIFAVDRAETDGGPLLPFQARSLPVGGGGDLAVTELLVQAWAQTTSAAISTGIAERALELAVAWMKRRRSTAHSARPLADHPRSGDGLVEMVLELEAASVLVERTADDWSAGENRAESEGWMVRLAANHHRATETAKRVVGLALEAIGGGGVAELERLSRDARRGGLQPPDAALLHDAVGRTILRSSG
jgi:alkylation response protein AidB-like acyl-CoA dehydrogenase